MFKSLVPWKRRSDTISVRHDVPSRMYRQGDDPLVRLRDEFDSLLNWVENQWFGDRMGAKLPSLWTDSPFDWSWDLGWEDQGDKYVYRAELPGFEPEDFEVRVSDNAIIVRAEHKDEEKGRNGGMSYQYGAFTRTLSLPHGVDEDKVEARYHSGVLELHLPKTEASRGKRIEVRSA